MFGVLPAYAQLHWESKELEFNPGFADSKVVAHFQFKNLGSKVVQIESVTSSCSCTSATSTSVNIAPEQSSEVVATFTIGDRVGVIQKIILVRSNDPYNPVSILNLKVNIPEMAKVTPTVLFWAVSEKPVERESHVQISDFQMEGTIEVSSEDIRLSMRVESSNPGKEWKIMVKPKQSDIPFSTEFKVTVKLKEGVSKIYHVHVRMTDSRQFR